MQDLLAVARKNRKGRNNNERRFNKTLKVKPIHEKERQKEKDGEGKSDRGVYADAMNKRDRNETHMDLLNS